MADFFCHEGTKTQKNLATEGTEGISVGVSGQGPGIREQKKLKIKVESAKLWRPYGRSFDFGFLLGTDFTDLPATKTQRHKEELDAD